MAFFRVVADDRERDRDRLRRLTAGSLVDAVASDFLALLALRPLCFVLLLFPSLEDRFMPPFVAFDSFLTGAFSFFTWASFFAGGAFAGASFFDFIDSFLAACRGSFFTSASFLDGGGFSFFTGAFFFDIPSFFTAAA